MPSCHRMSGPNAAVAHAWACSGRRRSRGRIRPRPPSSASTCPLVAHAWSVASSLSTGAHPGGAEPRGRPALGGRERAADRAAELADRDRISRAVARGRRDHRARGGCADRTRARGVAAHRPPLEAPARSSRRPRTRSRPARPRGSNVRDAAGGGVVVGRSDGPLRGRRRRGERPAERAAGRAPEASSPTTTHGCAASSCLAINWSRSTTPRRAASTLCCAHRSGSEPSRALGVRATDSSSPSSRPKRKRRWIRNGRTSTSTSTPTSTRGSTAPAAVRARADRSRTRPRTLARSSSRSASRWVCGCPPRTIVTSRFITLTLPSGVSARAISRCTNGELPCVAVKWFAISKSTGWSCSRVDTHSGARRRRRASRA